MYAPQMDIIKNVVCIGTSHYEYARIFLFTKPSVLLFPGVCAAQTGEILQPTLE